MKQSIILLLSSLSLFVFAQLSYALPTTISADGGSLVLNGEGSRTKFGLSLYDGGLYLTKKQKDASGSAVAIADEKMAIRMKTTSSLITQKRMEKIVREGFVNSTGSKTAMKKEIDLLLNTFAKDIKKGDVCDLIYVPGKGTLVYKNGKLGATIPGLAFKKALFNIWLGSKPAQESLKNEMLNK